MALDLIRALVEKRWFQHSITGLIVFNAFLLGAETSKEFSLHYSSALWWTHAAIQLLFVIEISLRMIAHAPRMHRFFHSGWNCFDFLVVALSLLPAAGPFATVARLARILRILRLLSVSKDLRLIVGTMLASLPSMGHVLLLLGLLFYVYGIIGNHFFGSIAPEQWGTLGQCFLTLFQILTLEGWTEFQSAAMEVYPFAWIYFISFVVLTVFVVINLFIAVVTNNLQAVKAEEQNQSGTDAEQLLADLKETIAKLESSVRQMKR